MIAGACYIPDEGKLPLGEDAHFIGGGGRFIGIADGVGSWREQGVDAGVFACELMCLCKSLAGRCPCGTTDPVEILDRALSETSAEGTATACVIVHIGKWLHAAVVGDCGFAIIREDKIIYPSHPQQKGFNHPYQLGRASPADSPRDAMRITLAVEPGDVVVAGSDGLFDNMFDHELLEVVTGSRRKGRECPAALACDVAEAAYQYSKDENRRTPFAEARHRVGRGKPVGGKEDDITVVVARVLCTCD